MLRLRRVFCPVPRRQPANQSRPRLLFLLVLIFILVVFLGLFFLVFASSERESCPEPAGTKPPGSLRACLVGETDQHVATKHQSILDPVIKERGRVLRSPGFS